MGITFFSSKKQTVYPKRIFTKEEENMRAEIIVGNTQQTITKIPDNNFVVDLFIEEIGIEAVEIISNYIDIEGKKTLLTSTTTRFNIDKLDMEMYNSIVNIKLVNNTRWINKFFESVNSRLPIEGIYIGRVETKVNVKKRILNRMPFPFNWTHYTFHFIFRRIAPKIKLTKKLYFHLTNGKGRVLTLAETLGRLVSCGFEIIDHKEIDNKIWFVVKKTGKPHFDVNPSYGPLFRMPRIGKNGEIIRVYKFRTMHPYAEYLQDYILKTNGYSEIGKPADDIRLTSWGKFMRKYWLDELPQLINVLLGEMKLVGVRPLSKRFLSEYPDDIKKMRMKHKPGCVPPYVALLKQDVKEYIESERTYLLEKERRPYTTDIKYFCKALYNILTNKIRSA
jgi:lipopolysaccharide/colanic/teichoic acid biosynthesis glycosyltransferase